MNRGFTLIELLVTISIISILIAAIFIALNPPELFAEARNARRWMEVDSIAKAIRIYELGGQISGIDINYSSAQVLGKASSGCDNCRAKPSVPACLDLSNTLKTLLPEMPIDPKNGTEENTLYYVNKDENGILEVGACEPELGAKIYVKR